MKRLLGLGVLAAAVVAPGSQQDLRVPAAIAALAAVPVDSLCHFWKAQCDSVSVERRVKRTADPLFAYDRMPEDFTLDDSLVKVGTRTGRLVTGLPRDPDPPGLVRVLVRRRDPPAFSDTAATFFVEFWLPGGPSKGAEMIAVFLHRKTDTWSPQKLVFIEGY